MVIEIEDDPKKPASDLVNEARELAAAIDAHTPGTQGRLRDLLSQLCDELDQQTSRIATQAESLSTCHDRMKLQKEAIEAAIRHFDAIGYDTALVAQLRSSIAPKGETK